MANTSKRGFASMDANKQREISSKGGKAAHKLGTAHEFTTDEAREAGRKGGLAVSQNRQHMSEIGRLGGEASRGSRRRGDSQDEAEGNIQMNGSETREEANGGNEQGSLTGYGNAGAGNVNPGNNAPAGNNQTGNNPGGNNPGNQGNNPGGNNLGNPSVPRGNSGGEPRGFGGNL